MGQIAVPQAFACFLEGNSYRDVIRNAVSTGGDSDTVAAIAGGMAECYYGVPRKVAGHACAYLNDELFDIVVRWQDFMSEMEDR